MNNDIITFAVFKMLLSTIKIKGKEKSYREALCNRTYQYSVSKHVNAPFPFSLSPLYDKSIRLLYDIRPENIEREREGGNEL